MATQLAAQGQQLGKVADSSNARVDTALDEYSRQRRNQQGPIELTPRGSGAPMDTPKPQ